MALPGELWGTEWFVTDTRAYRRSRYTTANWLPADISIAPGACLPTTSPAGTARLGKLWERVSAARSTRWPLTTASYSQGDFLRAPAGHPPTTLPAGTGQPGSRCPRG